MSDGSRFLVSLLVWSLFIAACACPAVKVAEGGGVVHYEIRLGTLYGIWALLLGWIFPFTLPGSANLLLLAGRILLVCKHSGAAACLGVAAALVGLTTWAFSSAWQGLLVGYYLWQTSLVSFAVGALALWFWQPAQPTKVGIAFDERDAEAVDVALDTELP